MGMARSSAENRSRRRSQSLIRLREEEGTVHPAAYTHGELGSTKSTASAAKLPLPEDLITLLEEYRKKSKSKWLFPSPVTGGPRSTDMILADHIKPVEEKLGLPRVG